MKYLLLFVFVMSSLLISCKGEQQPISKSNNSSTSASKHEPPLNSFKKNDTSKISFEHPKKDVNTSTSMEEYVPPATTLPTEVENRINNAEKSLTKSALDNEKKESSLIKKKFSKEVKVILENEKNIIKKNKTKKSKPNIKTQKKIVPTKDIEKKEKGRLYFYHETYQFGVIIEGDEIDHTFKFRNVGQSPISIENVEVSCGCTTPNFPFDDIMPGKQNEISVHFSSKNKWAHQNPSLTIYTNGEPEIYTLYLEGDVHERPKEEEKIEEEETDKKSKED